MKIKRDYDIELPVFNGPLDLLLHLIERHELDVTALSLAQVTDQYLQQVEELKKDRVPQMIDFIVVGARLMVIKSRALLPAPPITALEGEEEEDPAEALVRQLQMYRQFKEVARWLDKRRMSGLHTYLRVAPPPKVEKKLDRGSTTVETLHQLMIGVLLRVVEREESVAVAAPRTITIEGQIKRLKESVRQGKNIQFDQLLSGDDSSRTELSVTLLAVLEMIKRHEVVAKQDEMFGRITIEKAKLHTKD